MHVGNHPWLVLVAFIYVISYFSDIVYYTQTYPDLFYLL